MDHQQAGRPRLSIAIMSHPRRAKEAAALARALDSARVVIDPAPGTDPTPLKTAQHAWRAIEPGATHHLVVQDDVELSEGFLDRVRAGIELFSDSALVFYSNWSSLNGAAVRLASAAGATWVEETGVEYFPTLAMVLPADQVHAYLDFAEPFTRWWRDDDDVMREFLIGHGISAVMSTPSLVEHGSVDSLAGNNSHGVRRAAIYGTQPPGGYEAIAHSIEYLPWVNTGRVLGMIRTPVGPNKHEYLRRPWHQLLEPLGLDGGELRTKFDALINQGPRLAKAHEDLGDLFVHAIWLTSYLTAMVLRQGRVPMRVLAEGIPPSVDPITHAGLSTIAAGANAWTTMPMRLIDTYWNEAAELAEAGFAAGLSGE